MRVFLGLVALAASVEAVADITTSTVTTGTMATPPPIGATGLAKIRITQTVPGGVVPSISPSLDPNAFLNSLNWVINVPTGITALNFQFTTNQYTAQVQYRWYPNYVEKVTPFGAGFNQNTYWCDICTGGSTPTNCNTATGPGASPSPSAGYPCANLVRNYLFSGLVATGNTPQTQFVNSVSFQLFDLQTAPAPNASSYSFQIVRATSIIVGDPQIVGMQGQDFQVHGMPDEIFNIVSYPSLQVNARFTYLESAECHDNFTACFAHPGTYISEEGIRVGKDKIRVQAGSYKKGLTVTVNGKKAHKNVDLKHGAVEIVNHRRVVIHTDVMKISVSNSDKFLNQELELADDKLITLGATRTLLKDNERFHPEVPLHGLQGQTWRNVEYSSGLEYEGSIMDYHVVDGNIFGTDFVFNQFSS